MGVAVAWALLLTAVACGDGGTTGGTGGGTGQCSESPCKLVAPQCGCAADQRCTVDGQGAPFCATAGTAKAGQLCTATTNECVGGSVCVGLSTDVHVCAQFCSTDADCGSAICSRHLSDGKGGQVAGVSLCTDACDPIANGSCATGTACGLFQEPSGMKRWFTQCSIPAGMTGEGQSCASAPCAPGLACAATASGSVCHKLCDVKAGTGCVAPSKCVAFDTPVTIGTVEYGACQ